MVSAFQFKHDFSTMMYSNIFVQLFSSTLCSRFWRNVSVEPALFFALIAFEIHDFLNTNLYLQKSCRLNVTVEPDLDTPCDDEKFGILFLSSTYTFFHTATDLINVIFCIFASIYSDVAGKKRKIFIILAIVGKIFQNISATLQCWFWTWPASLGVVVDALFGIASGGHICIVIFTKVFVCDHSTCSDRLLRIVILTLIKSLCVLLGRGASGYLMYVFGFFYSYILCIVLLIVALIFSIILIHENVEATQRKMVTLRKVFNLKQLYLSFKLILWSKNSTRRRVVILLLHVVGSLLYFVYVGENSVIYLYFRYRFHWTERDFSAYSAYRIFAGIIGGLFCTLIMSKVFKIHECVIGAFASLWDTLAVVGFYFAVQNWQFFLVPLLDIFHGVAISSSFSFVSQFFSPHEFGRLNSTHMVFSLLIPFSLTFYNYIFEKTMDTFPNFFFLISVIINFLGLVAYCATYCLAKESK